MQRSTRCELRWTGVLALLCALAVCVVAGSSLAAETVYAQSDGVVVYSSPTTAAPVLATLAAGDSLLGHGAEGDWTNVQLDLEGKSTNGWVFHTDVGPEDPS